MVAPCLDKIDLPRLLSNLSKYRPWLSATAWNDWESFISSSQSLSTICQNNWDLQKFVARAIVREPVHNCLNEDLEVLVAKETEQPPKVNTPHG